MGKHQMRMAKATPKDLKKMYLANHILEVFFGKWSNSPEDITPTDFEHFEDPWQQRFIMELFEDGKPNFEQVARIIHSLFDCGSHGRVVMGCEILIDNVCDPNKDYLDYKPGLTFTEPEQFIASDPGSETSHVYHK